MKNENFKVGETIFYMELNKPKKSVVSGVITIEGKMEISYTKFEAPEGGKLVVYQTGFSMLKETEVFGTMEELKKSLFS